MYIRHLNDNGSLRATDWRHRAFRDAAGQPGAFHGFCLALQLARRRFIRRRARGFYHSLSNSLHASARFCAARYGGFDFRFRIRRLSRPRSRPSGRRRATSQALRDMRGLTPSSKRQHTPRKPPQASSIANRMIASPADIHAGFIDD